MNLNGQESLLLISTFLNVDYNIAIMSKGVNLKSIFWDYMLYSLLLKRKIE